MKRCALDLGRACTVDSDCNGGATGPCVQHPDVGGVWWVQAHQEEPLSTEGRTRDMAFLPPVRRRIPWSRAAVQAPAGRPLSKVLLFGPAFQEGLAFAGAGVHSRRGGRSSPGAPIRGAGRPSSEEEGDLNIKKKAEGDVMVLQLSGKIMGGPDHEKFHSEIKTLIKEGYVDILLNMSKVSWINSTGLGVLVSAFHTLKKNGGQLKICEVSDRIDNILNVTQLKLVFQTFESCEEALQSFTQP